MGGLHTGLIGWPVAHSLSPAMHNAAFDALGLEGRYRLHPIAPRDLAEGFDALTADTVHGLNVTVPHKAAVLRHPAVTSRSDAVKAIGACNTLVRTADGWHAENTDWHGALHALASHTVTLDASTRALLLGTGGAALAIAYALAEAGAGMVRFASRSAQLDERFIDYAQLGEHDFDLIVNCTPLGMAGYSDASPWPAGLPFPSTATLFDLIYTPAETPLMAAARAAGAPVIGGLPMLVAQARLSFALWTGESPDYGIMESAAQQELNTWHA